MIDKDTGEVRGPFLRSAYNYDMDAVSEETGLKCHPDEGMTQQQFADEADINTIVRRFGLTGELPENVKVPQYGDFNGIGDYRDAMNAVRAADEAFMALPAALRAEFANDPQRLLEFVSDEKNRAKATDLGLLKDPEPVVRSAVQAVDDLAAILKPPIAKP
ncbi:MAG: internal scaffolding protein [Microviridae sp.]|nr:MAG: internal scaffolding protein [Microviridae sp.]